MQAGTSMYCASPFKEPNTHTMAMKEFFMAQKLPMYAILQRIQSNHVPLIAATTTIAELHEDPFYNSTFSLICTSHTVFKSIFLWIPDGK